MIGAWKFVVGFVENMNVGFATYGFILEGKKWKIAPRTNGTQGKHIIEALMVVAAQVLHLTNIMQVRVARSQDKLPALEHPLTAMTSEIVSWIRGEVFGGDSCTHHLRAQG